MATSSLALSRAGLIDPTKPATYPVILGEDIRSNGSPSQQLFTGIRCELEACNPHDPLHSLSFCR